jgi:hypothetical protein
MSDVKWSIKGREFLHCNCAYGCPCQFNGLPTHGKCEAVMAMEILEGEHGSTRLDGLRIAAAVAWPGPIHLGGGRIVPIVDERATDEQRNALLRIMSGQDTDPGATFFQVFSTTFEKVHDPVFARIEFQVDVDERKAQVRVPGVIEGRGEPIVNPVTGQAHRVRIELPQGFEYLIAEVGRGWTKTTGPVQLNLQDSHAHFASFHMTQSGVIA